MEDYHVHESKGSDTVELTRLPNLTIGRYNSNEISSKFLYMHWNWQMKCDIYVEVLKAKNHLNNPEEESWTHYRCQDLL